MKPDKKQDSADADIVYGCIRGEERAWEQFYERFHRLISYKVRKMTALFPGRISDQECEECIQTIWKSFLEKGCDKLRKWEGRCSLANYIGVCSGNAAINFFTSLIRKQSKQTPYEEIPDLPFSPSCDITQDPLDQAIKKESIERVTLFLENLPERERFFSRLYWDDGLSYTEISCTMDIPVHNLHLIKYRIIAKLKGFMKKGYKKETKIAGM